MLFAKELHPPGSGNLSLTNDGTQADGAGKR